MAIRTVKPTSPARRYLTYVTYDDITKTEPEKGLLVAQAPHERPQHLRAHHRPPSRRRRTSSMLRQVDFRREKFGIPARVAAIEYDPNRSARLALLHYRDGEKRYIIAPLGLKVGRHCDVRARRPTSCPATRCPSATSRSARSCTTSSCSPGAARSSAGARAPRPSSWPRKGDRATLKLPSGEVRLVALACMATIGQVGNLDHENVSIGKAGRVRWRGLPSDGPRHGHEPRRPSDGRRRGQGQGQPPDDAVGQADQGLQDPAGRQAVGPLHRDAAEEIGAAGMGRSLKKGPYIDEKLLERRRGAEPHPAEEGAQDVVAAVRRSRPSSSATRSPCTTARSSSPCT